MIKEYQDQETKEKYERKSLYLSGKAIEILNYGSGQAKCSISHFANMVILQWYERANPEKELQFTDSEINKLSLEIEELKNRRILILRRADHYKAFQELRLRQKEKALSFIKRKIDKEDDPEEIEYIARHWANKVGISFIDLLYEAKEYKGKTFEIIQGQK